MRLMKQKNLIFLISQPRSGSTLLQKMLGANKLIYTRSEPWIALNPIYNLSTSNSNELIYSRKLEEIAMNDFISGLTEKENTYNQIVKNMLLELYNDYLIQHNKEYFLDKTPRYYHILDELVNLFPESKIIILIRNPLAVLNSLIPRKKSLYMLSENKYDLFFAIDKLIKYLNSVPTNIHIVYFEELVIQPEKELGKLCRFLNIPYEPAMVTDFVNSQEKWVFGDQKIYEKTQIDTNSIDSWIQSLENPQHWRLFYDYLQTLGKEKFEQLGYNYTKTLELIESNVPLQSKHEVIEKTLPLQTFLDNQRDALIYKNICDKEVLHVAEKNKVLTEKNKVLTEKIAQLEKYINIIKKKKVFNIMNRLFDLDEKS